MIGASGAIYGVFACMAILAPEMKVYVYFIPMRIKYALVLFALMDFLLIGAPDMIAHTAHLSGLFVGVFMGMRIKKSSRSRRFGRAHNYYSQR
ncbi:MAG: rhomboid family intramembrane serine protease, partial [Methanosarcinaceae archaeon]|nr:rhomboid family intramembrane serine protease [Methanosarcinaceae archaeon]